MTYKTVLVHAEADPKAAPRLETAAIVARGFGAKLLGLGAEMIQPAGVVDPYGVLGVEWYAIMRESVLTHLATAEKTFRCKSAGADIEWRSVEGYPAPAIARSARGADLIVCGGRPLGRLDPYATASTAELVLTCGRPVLVAPPTGGRVFGDAVVVAWKDTREARRAVADALPFLAKAETVVVLAVCEEDEEVEAARAQTADVAAWLRRHGVVAKGKVRVAPSDQTRLEIEAEADLVDADLIVAGAYGHSRMGEWVFGGVTNDLLHHPERFVLFSH